MLFAENLKRLRENNHLSKSDMAKKLDITPSAYGAYELKRREPSFDMLCKIADALHVSTDELLGHEVDELEKCKSFVCKAGWEINEIFSPPGCTTVNVDTRELNKISPLMAMPITANERERFVPIAFPNDEFIKWVTSAIEDAETDIEPSRQAALRRILATNLIVKLTLDMQKMYERENGRLKELRIENGKIVKETRYPSTERNADNE